MKPISLGLIRHGGSTTFIFLIWKSGIKDRLYSTAGVDWEITVIKSDFPDEKEAYQFKDQHMFGDNLLIAPIKEPVDPKSMLATKSVWLPQGNWVEWYTGIILKGPVKAVRKFAIDETRLALTFPPKSVT